MRISFLFLLIFNFNIFFVPYRKRRKMGAGNSKDKASDKVDKLE
jgi:hypothetical protein